MAASADKVDRVADAVKVVADDATAVDGLGIVIRADSARALDDVAKAPIAQTRLVATQTGRALGTETAEAAQAAFQAFTRSGSPVSPERAARVAAKFTEGGADGAKVYRDLSVVAKFEPMPGSSINGAAGMAGRMDGKTALTQAKGHAWLADRTADVITTGKVATANGGDVAIVRNSIDLGWSKPVTIAGKGTKEVFPDMVAKTVDGKTLVREMKHADVGKKVKATKENKAQIEYYKKLRADLATDGETVHMQYVVKGDVSDGFRKALQDAGIELVQVLH